MSGNVGGMFCGPAGLFPNNYMRTNFTGGGYNTAFSSPSLFVNNNFGGCGGFRGLNPMNSFGYGNYGCHHSCGGGGTPSWMNWMMGIGMGGSFLSNIIGAIWGGNNAAGAGSAAATNSGTNQAKPDDTDLKNLKALYGDTHTIVQDSDGSFTARPTSGGKSITAKTAAELRGLLDNPTPTVQTTQQVQQQTVYTDESPAAGISKKSEFVALNLFSQEYINNNYSPTQGLKYGDTYIKTLENTTLNITKLSPMQSDGLACELDELLPVNSDVTINNEAVKITGYNNDKTEITIGSTTYKITKESGDCIYLEPKDSSTGDKYVLIQNPNSGDMGFSLHKLSDLTESRTEHEKMFTPAQLSFDKSPTSPGLFITELKMNT